MAEPGHLSATRSVLGSMMKSVGHTCMGNFRTKGSFSLFSVSIEAQTNLVASAESAASPHTYSFMLRHVWHQGAQASTNSGRCSVSARFWARS